MLKGDPKGCTVDISTEVGTSSLVQDPNSDGGRTGVQQHAGATTYAGRRYAGQTSRVPCFRLPDVLSAAGINRLNFFSLDVEVIIFECP